jgi:hypothetical protein
MLPSSHHGGQIAFFEVAATLIPILVFSGVVAERNGPRPEDSYERTSVFTLWIPFFGTFAVLGEACSIAAIVAGPVPAFFVGFVAIVLTAGLVGVILIIWLPWLAAYKKRMPERYRGMLWSSVALLSIGALGTVWAVVESVGAAHSLEREEALVKACGAMVSDAERSLERNRHEERRAVSTEQNQFAGVANALEGLTRGQVGHAPPRLLKALEARVRFETSRDEIDMESDERLMKASQPLERKLDAAIGCYGAGE